MATSGYSVIMVTDSRSGDIVNFLDNWGDVNIDIVHAPSTGIEAGVEILIAQRRDATPDLVLMMNGICDILVKNKTTHKYFMMHDTVDETVEYYEKQVKRGQELLEIFFDESKWMFNSLTGADICDYNNPARPQLTGEQLAAYHQSKTPDPLQTVMDQAVLDINRKVVSVNKMNKVFTPYTATFVHRHYSGGYHHSYQHTRDGCHLKPDGKKYWAKEVKKAIDKTRQLDANYLATVSASSKLSMRAP